MTLSRDDVDADALIAAVRRALSRWSERTRRAPQVLIVDDHELNRRLLGALLERKGYRTLHAADGASALAQAREFAPALVLLDLAMPERDGFEVLSDLRRTPETQHIPVVALTALASREDRVRVEEAGFDGYLTKPIDRAALEALVARIVPDSDDA
ncbi:MAG: response regulator [Planctomycetota bacterium]